MKLTDIGGNAVEISKNDVIELRDRKIYREVHVPGMIYKVTESIPQILKLLGRIR